LFRKIDYGMHKETIYDPVDLVWKVHNERSSMRNMFRSTVGSLYEQMLSDFHMSYLQRGVAMKSGNLRQCPNCMTRIAKNGGCNNMTYTCHNTFTWKTNKTYSYTDSNEKKVTRSIGPIESILVRLEERKCRKKLIVEHQGTHI